MTKLLTRFVKSEIRYMIAFALTGLIVAFLADHFGLVKNHYMYHIINKAIRMFILHR